MVLVAHPYNNLVKGSINLTTILDELSKELRQFASFSWSLWKPSIGIMYIQEKYRQI